MIKKHFEATALTIAKKSRSEKEVEDTVELCCSIFNELDPKFNPELFKRKTIKAYELLQ